MRKRGARGTQSEGDLCLEIAVVSAGFSGRYDEAWVLRDDWSQFIAELTQLEKARRGQALITASSPNDFQLRVFASDRAGHIKAEGWVGREYSGRPAALGHHVSFEIEIDPTALPALLQQLAALSGAEPRE